MLIFSKIGKKINQYPSILTDGNTAAWYDAADLNTITKDSNNFVEKWADKLNSGNDLLQTTQEKKPLFSNNSILFDGINDALVKSFIFGSPNHFYVVVKIVVYGAANSTIVGGMNPTIEEFRLLGVAPKITLYATGAFAYSSADLAVGSFGIVRYSLNSSNSTLQVNNATKYTGSLTNGTPGGIALGGRTGNDRFANVEIKEVIARRIVDTNTNSDLIYNYLKTKWGL